MGIEIRWSPDARDHLRRLSAHLHALVLDEVERHLTQRPDEPTQKQKQLAENPLATWELRLGDIRVFYDVNREENTVDIVAVGVKEHNRLRIASEEVEL